MEESIGCKGVGFWPAARSRNSSVAGANSSSHSRQETPAASWTRHSYLLQYEDIAMTGAISLPHHAVDNIREPDRSAPNIDITKAEPTNKARLNYPLCERLRTNPSCF